MGPPMVEHAHIFVALFFFLLYSYFFRQSILFLVLFVYILWLNWTSTIFSKLEFKMTISFIFYSCEKMYNINIITQVNHARL